jgi:hypothetical protein
MPAAFLPGARRSHPGKPAAAAPAPAKPAAPAKPRRWIIWIGLGFLALVLVGAGIALWLLRPVEAPGDAAGEQPATPTTTAQVGPEPSAGAQTPAGRDEVRLQHISNLHTAFEQYRQVNSRYPEQLQQLVAYLPDVPVDPSGAAYPYQPSADGSSYQLQFTLESGGTYRGLRLLPGPYSLTPQGVQVPVATPPESTLPEPGATPPPATADADADGLTDVEEAQYTTEPNGSDTDADGYVDGVEIRGGFDPLSPGRTALDAGLVQRYDNVTQRYAVSYPTGWITRALDAPQATQVTFSAPNGEFFQVLAEENPGSLTPAAWYQQEFPGADVAGLAPVTIGGRSGVRSPDGLTAFVADGQTMYVLVYSLGGASQASYAATFTLFQSSFSIGG